MMARISPISKCTSDWDSQNCRSGMPMHARQIQLEFSMLACKPAMTGDFLCKLPNH